MKIRSNSLYLLVLALAFFLLLTSSVSAQVSIEGAVLSQVSDDQGLQSDSLSIVNMQEVSLPLTGVTFYEAKVIDQNTSLIYGASVDVNGGKVDSAAANQAEKAAYRATYGRLEPALYNVLQSMADTDRIQVGIWLKTPQLSTTSRPNLQQEQPELQDGNATLTPSEADREAVDTAHEKTAEEIAAGQAQQAAALTLPTEENMAAQEAHDVAYQQAINALSQQITEIVQPLVAELRLQGYEPDYVSFYAPLIFVELPKEAILSLNQREDVDTIYGPGEYQDMLDSARITQKGNIVNNWGFSGTGVKVAILEDNRIEFGNPYIPDGVTRDMGGTTDTHSAATAGIVASTHGTYTGIAPGVSLYSANAPGYIGANVTAAMDWAVSQGVHVINNSWGESVPTPGLNIFDRHLDYIVRNAWHVVTVSAGNSGSGCGGTGGVTSPAKGYNVISVGNYADQNTLTWADDAMDTCSSYVNPNTGVEKPELSAVGSSINSTTSASPWVGGVGSGTSYSSPMVAGTAALLMQRNTFFESWPEIPKAILIATALHNIEGASRLSDVDGAGGVDMRAAFHSDDIGNWDYGDFNSSSFPIHRYFYAFAGETVRVAIAWDSNPSGDYSTDPMQADLDLNIYNPSAVYVTGSSSFDNNYEIVEFTASSTGTYELRITAFRFDGTSEYVGMGWTTGHRLLSAYAPQIYSTPPVSKDYYRIPPSSYWDVIGIRSPTANDYDLELYDNSVFGNPSGHSYLTLSSSTAPVDFVLIDNNHAPYASFYPEVYKWSGAGGNYPIEWASHSADISEGTYGPYTMTPNNVVRVWDNSSFNGERKYFAIRPTAGNADLGMALYASNDATPSTMFKARSQYLVMADGSGAGGSEIMNYLPSVTDWMGLVVWNNGSSTNTTFYLYADTTPPGGTLSINNGAAATNSTSVTLNLSGVDADTGIYQMRFSNDNVSWSAWEPYAATKSWAMTAGDGTKTVYVQYKNNAEMSSSSISDTIILDTVLPTGTIVINSGAAYTNSTSVTLALSATDDRSGIMDMRLGNYLEPWGAWEPYTTSKAWTLVAGDGVKSVWVEYRDNAGNISIQEPDYITLDTTPPSGSVIINAGAAYTNSTSVNLTLSATDAGCGVNQMQFSNDGSSWSGWEAYATSKAWMLTSSDGTKTVYVQYRDVLGNASGNFTDTIILDMTPPSGSISINAGAAYTNSTSVNLTLSATDAGSGVSQMQFSNDGSSWSGWEAYTTSKAWTLTSGDGTRTVYVQYRDVLGNASGNFTDTIILDTTGPSGTLSINGGAAYTNSTSVNLTLSATDAGSGVSQMQFSNDGSSWSGWEAYATSKAWTLTSSEGTKMVYVQYRDVLGNASGNFTDTIIYDITPPTSIASSPTHSMNLNFTVSWTGSDTYSGLAAYDVQYRVGAGGSWTDWLAHTAATSAVFGPVNPVVVARGQTYFFRVRAYDGAGNVESIHGANGDTSTYIDVVFPNYLPMVIKQ